MAYIDFRLYSEVLHHYADVDIYFPNDAPHGLHLPEIRGVLTLLHGYGATSRDWFDLSSACRYAADNGLVLIAPDCGMGFYCDMVYGDRWYTYLTQELPDLLARTFVLPSSREQNFIAGFSMGGYGAMMIGMRNPDRYAGIASFSGAVDLAMMIDLYKEQGKGRRIFAPIFGEDLILPESLNLHNLIREIASLPKEQQPRLLFTCGSEDDAPFYIHQENQSLYQDARTLPLADYRYMEWTGKHEWKFWDRSLVYAIDRFLSPGYANTTQNDWSTEAEIFR